MGIAQAMAGRGSDSGPAGLVEFTSQLVSAEGTTIQTAGYRVNTSGVAEKRVRSVYTTLETWRLSGASADYEIRADITSGFVSGSSIGTWISNSTSPEWDVSSIIDGEPGDAILAMSSRLASSGAILDTWTVELYALRTSV